MFKSKIIYPIILLAILSACKHKVESDAPVIIADPKTDVSIGFATDTIQLSDNITLNATASYLLKSDVKANSTGYITKMNLKLGDFVKQGSTLFSLQTKEARALGNTINKLDPAFRFNGNSTVQSPSSGYVVMVNHHIGDYVQDGEVLATVNDASSFGFVMAVPYEYLEILKSKKTVELTLPDKRTMEAVISKVMPTVDPVSQTVQVLLKVADKNIPENLIANVSFIKSKITGLSVPKSSVVTDETQSVFWVMKLINDSTAVRTDFEKGLETDKWVQVKSGDIEVSDSVVISGNFGMGDTALVKIQKIIR